MTNEQTHTPTKAVPAYKYADECLINAGYQKCEIEKFHRMLTFYVNAGLAQTAYNMAQGKQHIDPTGKRS